MYVWPDPQDVYLAKLIDHNAKMRSGAAKLRTLFPALGRRIATCPARKWYGLRKCNHHPGYDLDSLIMKLNDHHHWSREKVS